MNTPIEVTLEDVDCPIGCKRNDVNVLIGRDLLHDLPGDFLVVKCQTCGLLRTNPRPTPGTIGFYYPDNYGPYLGTQVSQAQPIIGFKKRFTTWAKRIVDVNALKVPVLVPGRMLEMGCASGSYLHLMASQGWQVQGIEFSPKAAEAAAKLGYQVHVGALETAPKPDEPFDLIVGWMVLEHLHDPINCLKKLRDWAKPEAWLVISIPNAGSLDFQIFKENLYSLHLPNHLYHFTPQTLEKLLDQSGWRMDKVFQQRTMANFIASSGYVLRNKGFLKLGQKLIDYPEKAGRWSYLLFPLAWLFSVVGQTGRMTVWARSK